MTTLSVPLSPKLEEFIKNQVKSGNAANKADVVRKALTRMSEEEAVNAVLLAQREVANGQILRGDLREIIRHMKK